MSEVLSTDELLAAVAAEYDVAPYAERVRGLVTPRRFEHIVRVTHLALQFAEANGFGATQRQQVALAAILHDVARDMTDEELVSLAPPQLELERRHPLALHGRAGRALASSWGVTDATVLEAIEGHVFGVPLAHRVGMAVYVADVSEEGRGVNDRIRELALEDLPSAYGLAVSAKVEYLMNCGKEIHPETLRTYESIVGRAVPSGAAVPQGSKAAGAGTGAGKGGA